LGDGQTTSSEELMRLVQAGSRYGLSQLMRRYANPLLTFLHRMTGDYHLGEELFQETFLAVWVNRNRYQFPRPFQFWLFGIASNQCKSRLRERARRQKSVEQLQTVQTATVAECPLESVVATETASLVEQAVLQLPEQQREVVVMRVWNGLSYRAIGSILNRTEGTVRSHMHHALKSMRTFLEPRLRDFDQNLET